MGALLKLRSHQRVHTDHDLLLFCHNSVPFFDLLRYPFLKILSKDGSTNVDNPLFRHLGQVWLVREVVIDIGLGINKFHDSLHRQVLVLRHVQVLDGVVGDVGLFTTEYIF